VLPFPRPRPAARSICPTRGTESGAAPLAPGGPWARRRPNAPMNPDRPTVLVLGAGLAGLSAARRLQEHGCDVTVIEAADHVGGLAASHTIRTPWGEFDYDNGPHRFHTTDAHVKAEALDLLGEEVHWANRQSRIYLYGRFFHYPLQAGNVLRNLPPLVLIKAFLDYFAVRVRNLVSRRPDDNFENWVVNRFGRKLYDVFFGTYTEKTWGIPCTRISADWAAQRISLLSLWDTVKKTLFRPRRGDVPRTYVSRFFYPRRGGIGRLSTRYVEEIQRSGGRVLLGCPVRSVHVESGRVTGVTAGRDGEERLHSADHVLSTIPCTVLARLLDPAAPPAVLGAARALKHRSMIFVYLILDRPQVTPDHWIYLPEQRLITHRLSEFKNFSPEAAPPDKTLLCAEITCDFDDEDWRRSDEELQAIVVRDLQSIGLVTPAEVLKTFSRRERHAYPIYDLEYRTNRDLVLDHLAGIEGLDTTGRQGLFKYNNMDHSIGMGLAAADNLRGRGRDHRQVATEQEYFG
jgi:protoporphyrinogen oxidase